MNITLNPCHSLHVLSRLRFHSRQELVSRRKKETEGTIYKRMDSICSFLWMTSQSFTRHNLVFLLFLSPSIDYFSDVIVVVQSESTGCLNSLMDHFISFLTS